MSFSREILMREFPICQTIHPEIPFHRTYLTSTLKPSTSLTQFQNLQIIQLPEVVTVRLRTQRPTIMDIRGVFQKYAEKSCNLTCDSCILLNFTDIVH